MQQKTLRYVIFSILMVFSVACDQGTKVWARSALATRSTSVIDGYFDFHLAQNHGAAFSMLRDVAAGRWLLTGIGFLMLGMLFVWLRRAIHENTLAVAALGLIAGGAIGNLIDRIAFGSVTDFIYWHTRTLSWPVFNIADVVLVVGVGLMLISGFGRTPSEDAKTKTKTASAT